MRIEIKTTTKEIFTSLFNQLIKNEEYESCRPVYNTLETKEDIPITVQLDNKFINEKLLPLIIMELLEKGQISYEEGKE